MCKLLAKFSLSENLGSSFVVVFAYYSLYLNVYTFTGRLRHHPDVWKFAYIYAFCIFCIYTLIYWYGSIRIYSDVDLFVFLVLGILMGSAHLSVTAYRD